MSDTPSTQPAAESTSGRDPRGRFAAGNPGGPGNPFARRVGALRSALVKCVQEEDIAAVARALIEKARNGDIAAAKLLFGYVLGKPSEAVNPDRLDAQEWEGFKETADLMRELPHVGTAPAAELPLRQVRAVRPVLAESIGKYMTEVFSKSAAENRARAANEPPPPPPSPIGEFEGMQDALPLLDPAAWAELLDLVPSPNGENRPTPRDQGPPGPRNGTRKPRRA